ncbi:MAG: DUF2804 domain-containing protein [Thermodesulfobacteriota bacterium]
MEKLVDPYGRIDFGLIDEPVDLINHMDFPLATPSGRRRPVFLRKMLFKQFSFAGINCPELMIGVAVVDLKYAANAFFYVFDKADGSLKERKSTTLPFAASISPRPDKGQEAIFQSSGLRIRIACDRVQVKCREAELDAVLNRDQTSPLRICTRTGYNGWTYTQKTAPISVSGALAINGKTFHLSAADSTAITDWSAGYFRRQTFWNWAAATAILPGGRRFGMNFSCGVNETEATENVFWIDGRRIKVDNVKFRRNPRSWDDPWRITSADGRVSLSFAPASFRQEHLNAWLVASRFTQFLGFFSGRLTDPETGDIRLEKCPGWAEDHYARW